MVTVCQTDEKYEEWRASHPVGYVVNIETGWLHDRDCVNIAARTDTPGWKWSPKACSSVRKALQEWAAKAGLELTPCGNCTPLAPRQSVKW